MAERLGSIYAEVTLRTSGLVRSAQEAARVVRDLDAQMNQFSRRAAQAGAAMDGLGARIQGVASLWGRLAGLVSAITSAMAVRTAVDFNVMAEQAQIGFETMLGSAEEARRMVDDLFRFARETPLEFPGVLDAARRFLALGIAAEDVLPTLRIVTDAVSAMGGSTEMLNRVTMAIGQIATKGRVQMEELLQLAEAGIPVFEILRERLGLTQEQLQRIGAEGIGAQEALRALMQGLAERYGGAAARQARTLGGALSTLRDNIRMLLGVTFRPLTDRLRDVTIRVNELIERFIAAYRAGGLLAGLRAILPERAFRLFAEAVQTVRLAFERLAGVRDSSRSLLETLGRLALWAARAFYTLAAIVRWIADNWGSIRAAIVGVAQAFVTWAILTRVITLVYQLVRALRELNRAMLITRVVALLLRAPWAAIAAAAMVALLQVTGVLDALRRRVGEWLDRVFPDVPVPEIPPLDVGQPGGAGDTRLPQFPNLPSGAQAGGAGNALADLLERIRRSVEIARTRAEIAEQQLRLAGVAEESAAFAARRREALMDVFRAIQAGMERLRGLMGRLAGDERERAQLELLQLQREANEILLQIRENTKHLRPTFGLPYGVEPMRLFRYRAMQAGTRGLTITNPQFVFQVSQLPRTAEEWRRAMAGLPDALASQIEAAMAVALHREATAGAW